MSKQNVNFTMSQTGLDLDDLFIRRALFTRGGLWLWGSNLSLEFGAPGGQIGNNSSVEYFSSPVQTVSSGTNWKSASCGWAHTAAIKTDGTLWLWGKNSDDTDGNGQLGDNTQTDKSSPVQTVSGGTNWRQVTCGTQHTAAIKTDGSLWLWGLNGSTPSTSSNGYGALGDNTQTNRSSPVQTVSGGTNWRQVACGKHTAAIKTDGTLWLWGYNGYGGLGDNSIVDRSSPVQTVSGGTNWKQVACGTNHTAAIKTDGTLWLWGYNAFGQLGNNSIVDRSSPVQTVSGGTNWKQVACGYTHTAAIKTDGTFWTWGSNDSGELGDSTVIWRSSPVQTVSGGTNWKFVSAGNIVTSGIKTDGRLWIWGNNSYGQLGEDSSFYTDPGGSISSPIQTAAGGTNWKFVACGDFHTAAVYENN